nr:NADH-quinone oxidoreductase subunit A [Kordiimonas aquimaris]
MIRLSLTNYLPILYNDGFSAISLFTDEDWADKRAAVFRANHKEGTPMESLLIEYFPILVFLGIAIAFSAIFVGAAMLLANQNPDDEKLSAYECGFEAFEESRNQFDVRFYLVAILFIIFDLEVAFLFPWAITLGDIGVYGFWSMMVFLAVLTVGFVYEWNKGALEWE